MSASSVESIQKRRQQVQAALEAVHKQLGDLENRYLEETGTTGNVVRGWEGYIDSKPRATLTNKKEKRLKPSERIFSYSSATAPDEITSETGQTQTPSPVPKRGATGTATSRKRGPSKRKRLAEEED
ncbi:Chromatin modification-related protein MEAF6 [Hondaea fermentalgiana]|uniref:Chromatin modification-related protein MEAF6 n=1 Tax=Hondaea fermentalgiana TaxID=2315210 RepID=A0A2R5FYN0_9STRA|nr:Chromatin modification-related protein MEAF6 [Hondaea fermentalgiana]|eukprot:GBG23866.1 Chromatin modification-related protein MEAF6 [Hondaea fermentalgiana]